MRTSRRYFFYVLLVLVKRESAAFLLGAKSRPAFAGGRPLSSLFQSTCDAESMSGLFHSRRSFGCHLLAQVFGSGVGVMALTPQVASAKANAQEEKDKSNLLKGLERLNYLLENWEKETTLCGVSDNPYTGTKGCERTPIKVMEYMGYKSMDDPLFKAEKTMRRLEAYVPADEEGRFLDAVEKWAEAADEASGMAYVSSWGEANPGGGKDRVEYFIERAKKNVIDSRDSLATVIDILKLKAS